jgi:hypothetical protein
MLRHIIPLAQSSTEAEDAEHLLQEERERTRNLEDKLQQAEGNAQRSSTLIQSLQATEKELTDRTRDQVRI